MWKRNGLFIIVIVMYALTGELINFWLIFTPEYWLFPNIIMFRSIIYLFCALDTTLRRCLQRHHQYIVVRRLLSREWKCIKTGWKARFESIYIPWPVVVRWTFVNFVSKLFGLCDRILADCRHFYNDFLLQFISHFSRSAWNVSVCRVEYFGAIAASHT